MNELKEWKIEVKICSSTKPIKKEIYEASENSFTSANQPMPYND